MAQNQDGYAVHVVNLTEDHKYQLDEINLEQILMKEDIKDLPVAVISVAGAFRLGKSFLINFFIRYLSASPSARVDGSWLSEDSEPLKGFEWRGGSKRHTIGILLWSEPFVLQLPSGEKVAVLIMDTQGTFDSSSTLKDCSTIFALSTLLSSFQIYNLSGNIKEDDLQHLELFTEYGRHINDGSGRAFQVLEFLVRDWAYPWEYAHGAAGGQKFLEERFREDPTLAPELKEVVTHIRSCFERIFCFLMPHPGFEVSEPTYKGAIKDISLKFRQQMVLLASSIFETDKLQPKLINGEKVKAKQFFTYFKTYMNVFNNNKVNLSSLLQATNEAILMTAYLDGLDEYEDNMTRECGIDELCVPPEDIKVLHDRYKSLALNNFTAKKTMGSKENANQTRQKLSEEIDKRVESFALVNHDKHVKATESAIKLYEAEVSKVGDEHQFCVHPLDVKTIHTNAFNAALQIFDAARKRITNQIDKKRNSFIKDLESKYNLLEQNNDQNNKTVVMECETEFSNYMATTTYVDPPLSNSELNKEYEAGRKKALDDFKNKRKQPDSHPQDIYKDQLLQDIKEQFSKLKNNNHKRNKSAINIAYEKYRAHMNTVWNQRSECLHPQDLRKEHEAGVCKALEAFRPKKWCPVGFNDDDEDEKQLKDKIDDEYSKLWKINENANNLAVNKAYTSYKKKFEDLAALQWYDFIGGIIIKDIKLIDLSYHYEAKNFALEDFYSHRRNKAKGDEESDSYLHDLVHKINNVYAWVAYKTQDE